MSYEYWENALEGRFGPVSEMPECGFYRMKSARGFWLPVAVWPANPGAVFVQIGNEDPRNSEDNDGAREMWLRFAKHPVPEDDYRIAIATGRWPSDPPSDVAPAEPKPDETAPPPAKGSVPGDNAGDPGSFEAMRAALEGDIAEARAYYRRNPIKTKTDADKCENWRKRIYDAAKALDEKRKAEKKPWQDKADAVDAQYFPVIRTAQEFSGRSGPLDKIGQAWIAAEQDRRKEAADKAAAEHAARVAAAEADRKRIEEERAKLKVDDPTAYHATPEPELPDPAAIAPPAVEAPKVMIGTNGPRRGAQSTQHTATINDLKALALHLIAQRHPDLMECLQKIANAAARSKARTTLPGCRMSWETSGRAA